MPRRLSACLLLSLGAALLAAQEEAVRSGPKPGTPLPAPFDAYNLNGKAKGRQHCLVCEFGLRPVVLVFAHEAPEGKEGALGELLKKLDDAIDAAQEQELRGAVVFLSPDARSSATDPDTADPAKLIEEARGREALLKRLEDQAGKVKNLVVAAYPAEGPPGYELSPKAAVTVLFYNRLGVLENFAFGEGQFQAEDVERIVRRLQERLSPGGARKKAKA